ncbi:MAG TPA: hypothetical protein PLB30_02725 [Thermoleophilia bacterium]|nr:hypothetical protein [Thermoleophilia bacterium]HQG53878.1 hypothetical protein [Thermoleophilia bacterium]HQJ97452.1 hypothetical protein [Thermoleophilia bacterium]
MTISSPWSLAAARWSLAAGETQGGKLAVASVAETHNLAYTRLDKVVA